MRRGRSRLLAPMRRSKLHCSAFVSVFMAKKVVFSTLSVLLLQWALDMFHRS